MHATRKTYLPAAGKAWLLPLYDPFTKVLGVEASHRELINQAGINPGQRVLEIGCGTGNLAILVKRLNPASPVVAIDPDPKALARARRKAERRGAKIQFDEGFAEECHIPTRRSTGFSLHSCFTMSDQMQRPFLCRRPFAFSSVGAHYTSLISMMGNASAAACMGSSRASSIRVMARAPATPSSVSCSMPDS